MSSLFVTRRLSRRFIDRVAVRSNLAAGALGGNETLTRSAGGIYYFDANNVLQYTGDNAPAFESLGLRIEDEATSLLPLANYRDLTTWTFETSGIHSEATTTKNQIGIDAVANTACLLSAASATTYENKQVSLTVPNDSTTYTVRYHLKKDNDTTSFPASRVSFIGGTPINQHSMVNKSSGAVTTYSASSGSHAVESVGNWWRITQILANNSTGNTTLRLNAYPAAGTVFGTAATGATGSAIFDWFTVCSGQFRQSPIIGASTRYASFFSRPWSGYVNNFWFYADLYMLYSSAAVATGTRYIVALYKDANNYVIVRFVGSGGAVRVGVNNNGVYYEADSSNTSFAAGDRIRLMVVCDSINGIRMRATKNSATAYTASIAAHRSRMAALSSGANFLLGSSDGVTVGSVNYAHYADYRIGTGVLPQSYLPAMVGA